MRFTWVILALILVVAIVGCSKGNVLTGSTVAKTPVKAAEPAPEIAPQTAENPGAAEEQSDEGTGDSSVAKSEDAEETESVLGDAPVEEKDYSNLAGTCEVTSRGDIRVIDSSGKKTIYRDECIGSTLVEYNCEGPTLTNKNTNCPQGCIVENYIGKCA